MEARNMPSNFTSYFSSPHQLHIMKYELNDIF